jgi:hypothetical protein
MAIVYQINHTVSGVTQQVACRSFYRRLLKALLLGREPGGVFSIENAGSVEEACAAWQKVRTTAATHPSTTEPIALAPCAQEALL